jgi:hypothetical protein
MSTFQLGRYLPQFADLCLIKFRRTYDLKKLEKRLSDLRRGKKVQPQHVTAIFDSDSTPYARYWAAPSKNELERELKKHPLQLNAERQPQDLLRETLAVLKNLDTAALLLRCVHPQLFAVYSIPVVNLLRVHAPNAFDHYLAYCEELSVWRDHFCMPSVAETDVALWVFHETVLGVDQPKSRFEELQAFERDEWILRRRVRHAVVHLIQQHGGLGLARALVDADARLAAMLAGEELERRLETHGTGCKGLGDVEGLTAKLDLLRRAGRVNLVQATELKHAIRTRNVAVHAARPPQATEVEAMVEVIERTFPTPPRSTAAAAS